MRRTLDDLRNGMGGFEGGDDALELGELEEGLERLFICGVGVFGAVLVPQPCVLGAHGGVIEAG